MTRRYYVPDLQTQAPVVQLPDEEASHASRVMRVQTGDRIELFDGCGHQADAEVVSVSKRECVVRCDPIEDVDREPSIAVDLAIGLPKPDRAKEMIERLTELGVARVFPIVFERTQRPPKENFLDKLRRIVIESCKQSGRNVLMTIESPIDFVSFTETLAASSATNDEEDPQPRQWSWQRVLVAMPDSPPLSATDVEPTGVRQTGAAQTGVGQSDARQINTGQSGLNDRPRTLALIGPEGGLSEAEHQRCVDVGAESIGLGRRILRIETAAAIVAARLVVD
ncbi:RsmE family RNA methyltransferase [Rhodopirellula baltica]|uniref:Ribosomal RNA small subunit methyltransferase E n=1 Tax=Rhodopirellula baltica WH47 TaxID=991778 RepID=F2AXE4_RHOBT|nr:RsmE family RNA methyltransferase [Rhodopirellula baltica]EGF25657.1 Ribosomal RNA small subunit methyltransferase E [Rhodopirellula baltica WH47]